MAIIFNLWSKTFTFKKGRRCFGLHCIYNIQTTAEEKNKMAKLLTSPKNIEVFQSLDANVPKKKPYKY